MRKAFGIVAACLHHTVTAKAREVDMKGKPPHTLRPKQHRQARSALHSPGHPAHMCLLQSSASSSQSTAPTLTTPFSASDSFTHLGASCWQCPHLQGT